MMNKSENNETESMKTQIKIISDKINMVEKTTNNEINNLKNQIK